MSFKVGDSVYNGLGEIWTIVEVETPDHDFIGATVDTGMYTVKEEDGSIVRHTPGYLMQVRPR